MATQSVTVRLPRVMVEAIDAIPCTRTDYITVALQHYAAIMSAHDEGRDVSAMVTALAALRPHVLDTAEPHAGVDA